MNRHPAMRRRGQPGDAPDRLPAAIALPPPEGSRQGSRRLAFEVPADAVEAVRPPPLLADALRGGLPGQLPNDWTGTAGRLVAIGERFAFAPRLFGSLMWQCVTGLPYVRDSSDFDLLWTVPPGGEARVPALLDALDTVARNTVARSGRRLDGEIVFADIGAANWRELLAAGPGDAVLVKTETAVTLMTRAQLLEPATRP
jgi:phosphoribosyl-dephospho-CoA transferase